MSLTLISSSLSLLIFIVAQFWLSRRPEVIEDDGMKKYTVYLVIVPNSSDIDEFIDFSDRAGNDVTRGAVLLRLDFSLCFCAWAKLVQNFL